MSTRKIDLEALAPTIQRLWFTSGLEVSHQETAQVLFGWEEVTADGKRVYFTNRERHSVAIYRTKSMCWFAVIPFGELLYATPPYASRTSLLERLGITGWQLFQRMVPNHISLEIDVPRTTEGHRP